MSQKPQSTIPVVTTYRVKRAAMRNRYSAEYACPFVDCGLPLNSSETEIGDTEHCPYCGTVFRLDRRLLDLQKKEDEAAKEAGREERRQAKQKHKHQKKVNAESRKHARLQRDEKKTADRKRREIVLAEREKQKQEQLTNEAVSSPPPVRKRGFQVGTVLVLILFYFSCGFFVVQPIGAIPDGVTILYFRMGTNMPFVGSADGLLIDRKQPVSLLGRGVVLAAITEKLAERKILNLPYLKPLYLWSTGWKEFER